jgi:hypothetical protein
LGTVIGQLKDRRVFRCINRLDESGTR